MLIFNYDSGLNECQQIIGRLLFRQDLQDYCSYKKNDSIPSSFKIKGLPLNICVPW